MNGIRSCSRAATKVGDSAAARAVGQAMAQNPFTVIVPCHRVLASGGERIGGFSARGGAQTKVDLLALEGLRIDPDLLNADPPAAVDQTLREVEPGRSAQPACRVSPRAPQSIRWMPGPTLSRHGLWIVST